MLFTPYQIVRIVVVCMIAVLSGCTAGPSLSLPISLSLNRSNTAEAVSLRPVGQNRRAAFYRPARSSQTIADWPQPSEQSIVLPPHQPATPFVSHPVSRGVQQPMDGLDQKAGSSQYVFAEQQSLSDQQSWAASPQQEIRQVAQQQYLPPVVVQWDNHQQPNGGHQTGRTYATPSASGPSYPVPQVMDTHPCLECQQVFPPNALPDHTVQQLGEGCGEAPPPVDGKLINELVQRIEKLETDLSSSNQSMKTLMTSLAAARMEISRMKKDVDFWQNEVVRLEQSMKSQHRSDIESLNQISRVLETLLVEDKEPAVKDSESPEFEMAVDPFVPASR